MNLPASSVEDSKKSVSPAALLAVLWVAALLLRLAGMRWAQVAHGDAVSRIFLVWEGIHDPVVFLKSTWGMLHFLFMAVALRVWSDPVHSPVLMHIVFSVTTVIPFYFFVRREWGKTPALYVSAATLFYPVAIRQSYLPLTEVPFVFFVVCAMNFLSAARKTESGWYSVLSGLFLTLSCAMRMEGWLLIPMFAVLFRFNFKLMLLFVATASVYPCVSMVQNDLASGDPLPWLTIAREWQINVSGVNENLTARTIIHRLIYFPSVLFFGMTPLLFICCAAGAVLTIRAAKTQRAWLLAPAALLCIFMIQAARGLFLLEIRYSLILGYLFLPFAAETVQRFQNSRRLPIYALIVLLSMVPLSYSRVVYARVLGPHLFNPFPPDLEVIPKVSRRAVRISHHVINELNSSDGLIIDFFNWKDTRYVALMSHLHPSHIWFLPGARYEKFDSVRFSTFLKSHPQGIVVRADDSRWLRQKESGTLSFHKQAAAGVEHETVHVDFMAREADLTVYRYRKKN